jgi:hypothetical protein
MIIVVPPNFSSQVCHHYAKLLSHVPTGDSILRQLRVDAHQDGTYIESYPR